MQRSSHGNHFLSLSLSLSLSTLLGWILSINYYYGNKKDDKSEWEVALSASLLQTFDSGFRDPETEFASRFFMDSSDRLFNRHRTVHQILGGGLVADVMLWRRKNVTMGILFIALAAWVVFERSGYTLLSLVSSVLLLLIAIFFLWAKSAAILNRPAPPLPDLYLSEDVVNEAADFIRSRVNTFLSVSEDIALGKDSKMFFKVAACLWLISIVGGWTDFLTLGYTSLVIVLTVPALYERYEEQIDRYVMMGYIKLLRLYVKLDVEYVSKIRKWILEKRKLS